MELLNPASERYFFDLDSNQRIFHTYFHQGSENYIAEISHVNTNEHELRTSFGDFPLGFHQNISFSPDGNNFVCQYRKASTEYYVVTKNEKWGPFKSIYSPPYFTSAGRIVWLTQDEKQVRKWNNGAPTTAVAKGSFDPHDGPNIPMGRRHQSVLAMEKIFNLPYKLISTDNIKKINSTFPPGYEICFERGASKQWKFQTPMGLQEWWKLLCPQVTLLKKEVAYVGYDTDVWQVWLGSQKLAEGKTLDSNDIPDFYITPSKETVLFRICAKDGSHAQIILNDKASAKVNWISNAFVISKEKLGFMESEANKVYWREYQIF